MELYNDFIHEHPLMLCEKGKEVSGDLRPCSICFTPVWDPTVYTCSKCNLVLHLHNFCAKLPKQIISAVHPKHPLALSKCEFFRCDNCTRPTEKTAYACSICNIKLDIDCASKDIFKPQGHEHSFILLMPTSFTCDACGEESNGVSFLCTTCQLQLHNVRDCSRFPVTVKQIGHHHPLKLTYSVQLDYLLDHFCKICCRLMKTEFCFYYCESCTYFAHLKCASLEYLRDKETEHQDEDERKLSLTTDVFDELCLGENHTVKELKHSGHEHCLTLSNEEPKNDEICDGCVQPISAPFYSCQQCNFFLHDSCAKLPRHILSPLHPHPLTLMTEHWSLRLQARSKTFEPDHTPDLLCSACRLYSNGFLYKCERCLFFLDVKCSTYSDSLRHKGHEHTLRLIPEQKHNCSPAQESSDTKCNACGLDCHAKFKCEECDFNLDLRCASLPYTAKHECPKHKWKKHPLHLTFGSVEYETGEYYCDVCEEPRSQNDWFFYCEDCDYQVHPSCILGEHNIKSGSACEHDSHPHPLTLVVKAKGHRFCACCDKLCENFVLHCDQCDFTIHHYHFCARWSFSFT